jgi:hypothetical protein
LRRSILAIAIAVFIAGAGTLWSPAARAQSAPGDGPGGPVLAVVDNSDPFGRYYAEILRAEGLNEFAVKDKAELTAAALGGYQVVVLAQTSLTAAQVTTLTDWVQGGGNLIAMRPDPQLAGLLGLGADVGDLANGYLKVATGSPPGAGITGDTMQFHDSADLRSAAGATTVATLYSNATAATSFPAVTLRSVGTGGGQAAAFTYDLARSIVHTRQGNPDWAGQERDGQAPIRSDDLFFGGAQADWVNLDKVAIPQADEQQRLLANLIEQMNLDRAPLPRFWYLPSGSKAAVVLSGDDHGNGGTIGQFNTYEAASPAGCSVGDWECVRSTSYVYPSTPLSDDQVAGYQAAGFEIALHLHVTGPSPECNNPTPAGLSTDLTNQLADVAAKWPSMAAPVTSRTHCIVFSDWSTEPSVEASHGIRLDANYYYWPGTWVQDRPGFFTGSGFPMRFADSNGALIDVYQAATQLTDESDQTISTEIKALLDKALGAEAYYGVITANMHTDLPDSAGADAIVAEATSRGVPVVSAKQLLTWLDGRNASSFQNVGYSAGTLTFSVSPGSGARDLPAMVPTQSATGTLVSLTRGGGPVATSAQTIKGIGYAFFDAAAGSYVATYGPAVAASPTGTRGGGSRDRKAPRVTVSRRAVRASRKGIVILRVTCPRSERHCFVDLKLRRGGRQLAHRTVTVGGGKTAKVRLHLTRSARRQLRRHRSLLVDVRATARDAAGNRATTTTRIRLLAPRRR